MRTDPLVAAGLGALIAAAPAPAQTTPSPATGPVSATIQAGAIGEDASDTIVVTGSRIARPTLDSPIPVTTLSVAELTRTGQTNIGDVLNDLPSLRSTYSQANSTQFIGTSGLNLLDLRGLGVPRTLVLVNGRRHITSVEGEFQIDTNTIPTDLIDRVDIVTGGSSAVYGSDAMAGVVNFVLKRDFSGISLNGQSGVAEKGYRGTYRLAGTFGQNFAGGRGNIAVSLGYDHAEPLSYTDRPEITGAFAGRNQFQLVNDPSLNNGQFNRTFLTGIHSFGYSNGGSFVAYRGSSLRRCGKVAGDCLPNGFPRVFLFQPDGSLKEANYGVDFRPVGSGNNQGGDGATLNDTGVLDPGYTRYVGNILAHYDFSDAFRPFVEAKFVRSESQQVSSPTFSQGGRQSGVGGVVADLFTQTHTPIGLDNPFLTPTSRALIQSLLPPGATYFNLNRNNVDLGSRGELDRRDTYRVVVGVEGTFNNNWHYDVSANYGHLSTRYLFTNNRIDQNFFNAVDATTNAAGNIVCRINAITVTDPACAPVNLLGNGNGAANQAALNYFNTTSRRDGRASELDLSGNLVGDLSQLFKLPGGPVRFAIGAEYRRETASYAYDALVTSGATFLNATLPFNPPSFEVTEGYGEVDLPVFKNKPFIEELSLNGAGRVASYKGSVGTVYAYNAGGIYAPVRDIKFRVNYSRSVRAPTLGDLYSSNSQNFAGLNDPCDTLFVGKGRATRPANCLAAGVPAGFENNVTRAQSLAFLSGGNPNLKQEESTSWTYGAIIQPRFVPGLATTADY